MIVGSITNLGLGLFTTAMGGVNCFIEGFGSRPLLAGVGDRSPPPPPPCICCFCSAILGTYGAISGATKGITDLAICCTALLDATVNSRTTTVPWIASENRLDFLSLP